jgi:hypothetical protein
MTNKNWTTVYYKDPSSGVVTEHSMFLIDAKDAVRRYPDQYKLEPFDGEKPAEKAKPAPLPKV